MRPVVLQPRFHRGVRTRRIDDEYIGDGYGEGVDVKTLQDLMGHEDATVTLNTYAAVFADRRDAVSDAFSRELS